MALITVDLEEIKGLGLADGLVLLVLVALLAGIAVVGRTWGQAFVPVAQIDLGIGSLAWYSVLSLSRGCAGILISLVLTFWWGLWAAKSAKAEKVILPLVDILQSIPVLGFMPGLVLGMVALFPHSRVGLELAGILLLVTSQAWNMILAFYHSVRSLPADMTGAADAAGLRGWRRFMTLELPAGMNSLVRNSMLSMAGGWFFLIVSETFQLGPQDFRLPGIGSYMVVAMDKSDVHGMLYAVLAMLIIVICTDQLLWRPLLKWAARFRMDDSDAEVPKSWLFDLLAGSARIQRLMESLARQLWNLFLRGVQTPGRVVRPVLKPVLAPLRRTRAKWMQQSSTETFFLGILALALAWGGWRLLSLLQHLSWHDWAALWSQAGLTFIRITVAVFVGSLWAIPLGIRIGMSPRLLRWLGPLIQIAAAFPAPMLFPAAVVVLFAFGISLNYGSIFLMMMATSWYILFNVIAGAGAIPQEQRQAWAAFGPSGWPKLKHFLLPTLLPSLIIGWETATGGAWNASIVTEYLRMNEHTYTAQGLGATVNLATEKGDLGLLTASVLVMVAIVVGMNRFVWHRMYDYANRHL